MRTSGSRSFLAASNIRASDEAIFSFGILPSCWAARILIDRSSDAIRSNKRAGSFTCFRSISALKACSRITRDTAVSSSRSAALAKATQARLSPALPSAIATAFRTIADGSVSLPMRAPKAVLSGELAKAKAAALAQVRPGHVPDTKAAQGTSR
jgi:hypothetical protein